MAWGKVDDKLWGSPKWLAAPPRARALWVSGLSWCMDQLTDGRVPRHVLPSLGGTSRDAAELVAVGLWESADDGWVYHDWLDYQPSRQQVLAERKAAAERQRRAREKARESRRDTPVTHGDVTALVTVPPTRPDPTRPVLGVLRSVDQGSPSPNRHSGDGSRSASFGLGED